MKKFGYYKRSGGITQHPELIREFEADLMRHEKESAEGVGKETIFLTFKATDLRGRGVPVISYGGIAKVRD
jgi:hypothetical protein